MYILEIQYYLYIDMYSLHRIICNLLLLILMTKCNIIIHYIEYNVKIIL